MHRGNIVTLANVMLGVGVFLGGFVMFEPAPYELVFAIMLAVWFTAGLKISRAILPMFLCLFLFSAGGVLSTSQMPDIVVGLR